MPSWLIKILAKIYVFVICIVPVLILIWWLFS